MDPDTTGSDPHPNERPSASIRGSGGVVLPAVTVSGAGQVRTNFSLQHLSVAAKLSREVGQIETANKGRSFGPFFEDARGACVGCVILATAGAEAYINEIFVDRKVYFAGRDQVLLNLLWSEFEQKKLIDKYDLAMQIGAGKALDRGSRTTQSLDRLIRLRNALIHFKPEWPNEAVEHEKLSKRLKGYVVRSPWLRDRSLFPLAWASHGSSVWAVCTVVNFIGVFSTDSGIPNRLQKFLSRLDPKSGTTR